MVFRLASLAHVAADSLVNTQSVFSNPVKYAFVAYFTQLKSTKFTSFSNSMAEREGFEPSKQLTPLTRFPSVRLKPLSHLSAIKYYNIFTYGDITTLYLIKIRVPIEICTFWNQTYDLSHIHFPRFYIPVYYSYFPDQKYSGYDKTGEIGKRPGSPYADKTK